MIYAGIALCICFGIVGAVLFVSWVNRNAPREDHDFLQACGWREEAEAEVEALRNKELRKFIRGDGR